MRAAGRTLWRFPGRTNSRARVHTRKRRRRRDRGPLLAMWDYRPVWRSCARRCARILSPASISARSYSRTWNASTSCAGCSTTDPGCMAPPTRRHACHRRTRDQSPGATSSTGQPWIVRSSSCTPSGLSPMGGRLQGVRHPGEVLHRPPHIPRSLHPLKSGGGSSNGGASCAAYCRATLSLFPVRCPPRRRRPAIEIPHWTGPDSPQ